jgi:hypothetical protein
MKQITHEVALWINKKQVVQITLPNTGYLNSYAIQFAVYFLEIYVIHLEIVQ